MLHPDIVRDLTFWEKEAADWEAKQNYRQALRARFIFLLLTLDGVNLISYHRARTTGDYLHDLEDRPERTGEWALPEALRTLVPTLIRELEPLAHAFDRAWYGPTETTEEEYTPLKAIILRTTRQLASQPGKQTTSKATPVVEGSANL